MPTRYTREALDAAVAASRTMSEVVRRLGGRPTDGSRQYARRRIREWGIDGSHLERDGIRHTEQRLREAVAASASVAEVVRRLGISPVGGNHAHIGRRIARLGIDTTHFSVRGGRPTAGGAGDPLVLGSPSEGRTPPPRLRAALLAVGVAEACAECGTGPVWCGEPLRLEVDHVNGSWWDNRPSNLRLLCPNCHAVTDTYRGRARGGRA